MAVNKSVLMRDTIDVAWLEANTVCTSTRKKFSAVFGASCEVTVENIRKMAAADIDLSTIGYKLLKPPTSLEFSDAGTADLYNAYFDLSNAIRVAFGKRIDETYKRFHEALHHAAGAPNFAAQFATALKEREAALWHFAAEREKALAPIRAKYVADVADLMIATLTPKETSDAGQ